MLVRLCFFLSVCFTPCINSTTVIGGTTFGTGLAQNMLVMAQFMLVIGITIKNMVQVLYVSTEVDMKVRNISASRFTVRWSLLYGPKFVCGLNRGVGEWPSPWRRVGDISR